VFLVSVDSCFVYLDFLSLLSRSFCSLCSMDKAGCQAKRSALFAHVWKVRTLPAHQRFVLRDGLPMSLSVDRAKSLKW